MRNNYWIYKILGSARYAVLFVVLIFGFFASGIGVAFLITRNSKKAEILPAQPSISEETIVGGQTENQKLTVNAQLQVRGQFYLAPSNLPEDAAPGTIAFDQDTNTLQYFNGESFVVLTSQGAAPQDGVTSLQGQTGAITFSPGAGISINGTTISNSGILGINGVAGDINVTTANGIASLSLPQSIAPTATPTFNGVNLTTALNVASGGTGATSFTANGILYGNGSGAFGVATTGVPGQCLISTAGAPTFGACAGGGSGVDSVNSLTGNLTISNASGVGTTITINDASTAQKGIVQFNGTNFSVVAGVANTIQDISTSSSPTFASISLSSPLTVANGGTGRATLTANAVLVGNGSSQVQQITSAGAGECLISTAGAPIFTTCPGSGGVASIDGQTGVVTVSNATGSAGNITIDNASTAQKGIAQFNSTNFSVVAGVVNTIQGISTTSSPTFAGLTLSSPLAVASGGTGANNAAGARSNLGAAASGANGDITSTTALNTITPSAALTVGAVAQSFTLQGSSGSVITGRSGAFTTSVGFATPTANATINIPALAAGTYTFCTSAGNCTASGVTSLNTFSGAVTIQGVSNRVTVNNSANTITISTPQDINTTSSPTFNGLNLTSLTINGDIFTDLTGTGLQVVANVLQTTLGTSVDLTTEVTGVLPIANGGTNSTTAAGARSNLGAAASGANADITSTTALNTITPSAALTVGATSQSFLIQGSATSTLTSTSGAFTTTVGFVTPTANSTINFPTLSAGTYQVCTTSGNCLGGAGGATTSLNNLSSVAINTSLLTGAGNIDLGSDANAFRSLYLTGTAIFEGSTADANEITLSVVDPTADITYRFADAAVGTYDICTTAGNCSGVGGGVTTVGGTANRLPVFSAAQAIVNSWLLQNGTTLELDNTRNLSLLGGNLTVTGNGTVTGDFGIQGNTTIGNANTDTLTINAGTSGAGITLGDATFQSCTALETNASGVLVCGTDDGSLTAGNDIDITGSQIDIESQLDFVSVISRSSASLTLQTVTSGDIFINPADTFNVGTGDLVVDATGNTSLGGALTVTGLTTLNGNLTVQAGDTFTFNNDAFTDLTGTGLQINAGSLEAVLGTSIDLTSEVTGTLPVTNGGTGGATAQAAINNIAGLTTDGDLLYYNGTNVTRIARGSTGECLLSNATTILWATCTGDGTGVTLVGALDGGTPDANGAQISGSTIYLQSATGALPGVINTSAQTLAGVKTFAGGVTVDGTLKVSDGSSNYATIAVQSLASDWTVTIPTITANDNFCLENLNNCGTSDIKTDEIITVAANNSTAAQKAAADYVADGTDDQVEINNALTAAAGGKVLLLGGTYITHRTATGDATIFIPNNTTLAGVGPGTLIELGNIDTTDNLIENSDTTTGTGVVIRDLRLNGRDDLNTSGTQKGIYFNGMGAGTGATARQGGTITNVLLEDFKTLGINLNASSNNTIIGNNITGNNFSNFNSIGLQISSGSNNNITGNVIQGNGAYGAYIVGGSNNTFTSNSIQGNDDFGIYVGSSTYNTISGNTFQGNNNPGIYLSAADYNNITGNTVQGNVSSGINLSSGSYNKVSDNTIHDNGGATLNNGIYLGGTGYNQITSNYITDTACTTSCYAINIASGVANKNYLEGNRFSGSAANAASINDIGVNTIYVNQQTNSTNLTNRDVTDFTFRGSANSVTAFMVQNASGGTILNVDTSNGELEVGSASLAGKLAISDGSSNNVTLTVNALAGDYSIAIPTITGNDTFCLVTLANCSGSGVSDLQGAYNGGSQIILASNNAVQIRDNATPITGNLLEVQNNGGTTTFFAVDTGGITVDGTVAIVGNTTANRPGTPSAGEIWYDTDTDTLLTFNGTKWIADRGEYFIVAANDSSQAEKDTADYVADGTADQTEINNALTAASGGKVLLLAGTYTITGVVSIPNNTTLSGVGKGTLIQLEDIDVDANIITNSDSVTGTGVIIRDMILDGRSNLNTAGVQKGIALSNMGSGTGSGARYGAEISNVEVTRFRTSGIELNASANTSVTDSEIYGNNIGVNVISSSNNVVLSNLQVHTSTTSGVIFNGVSNGLITNSTITGNSNYGIYLNGASNSRVEGNYLTNNTNSGIYINASSNYSSVVSNVSNSNTGYGIQVTSSTNLSITGNNFSNNTNSGIYLSDSGATDNTISGNMVANNGAFGINLNSAPRNNVSGNEVISSTSYNVYVLNTNDNIITGNRIHNSDDTTNNNGIYISGSDRNSIIGNTITDNSCTTDCYAINVTDATSDKNYIEGNRYSGDATNPATIRDQGTGTIFANQQTNSTNSTDSNVSDYLFKGSVNSTTAFKIQNASGVNVFNIDTSNGEVEVGSSTLAGKIVLSDGSSNVVNISVSPLSNNYNLTIPTLTANDTFCLVNLANCVGLSANLTDNISNAWDVQEGANNYININTTNGSENISFGNSTTNQSFAFLGSGNTTYNGNIVGNNVATATTGNTESTPRTNVTNITLDADSFNVNDVILFDNAGQDYFTRVTVDNANGTYTVSPAVSYDADVTVTKYTIQNIGATATDYASLTNRFFQGYFLGGVVTGAGSTTLSDGNLNSTSSLYLQRTGGNLSIGDASSNAKLTVKGTSTAFELATTTLVNYSYTGGTQSFVVPAGLTTITVEAYGAQGANYATGVGGNGGYIRATVPVTPGETLQINVGGQAGWNGGGTGSAAGGGATDIRYGSYTLNDRLVIAGGGGGGAESKTAGVGGYPSGTDSDLAYPSCGGGGGTQTSGGVAGNCVSNPGPGIAGTLGIGGNGGYSTSGSVVAAAGGGGGLYGGGGGGDNGNNEGAGGGGSSGINTSEGVTLDAYSNGSRTGNGYLSISYVAPSSNTNDSAVFQNGNGTQVLGIGADGSISVGSSDQGARIGARGIGIIASGTITSSGITVTGTSTKFTSQINVGDVIEVNNERHRVASISSDTSLTLSDAFTSDIAVATTFQVERPLIKTTSTNGDILFSQDSLGNVNINSYVNGSIVQGFYLQGGSQTLGTTTTAGKLLISDGSSNTLTIQTASLTNDITLTLSDAAAGTYEICTSAGNCGASPSAFANDGNSFGQTAVLGTNDNYGLNFEVNNTTVATISNTGQTVFKNATNSTTAFQVQNAAGTSTVLNVDTTNNRVGIGTVTPTHNLEVIQAVNTTTTLSLGYNTIPLTSTTAFSSQNFQARAQSSAAWTTSNDTTETAIYSIEVDTVNGVMYAGSSANGIIYRCVLSTSCDASGDWTTSYDTTAAGIWDFVIDTTNSVLYAGTGNGGIIFRCVLSTNCDASGDWTTSYDSPSGVIIGMIFDSANGVIYAGETAGIVYRCAVSTACDAAGDWTTSIDTTADNIYGFAIDPVNGVLYAIRNGGASVYRCVLSTACDASGDWSAAYTIGPGSGSTVDILYDSTTSALYAANDALGIVYRCATNTGCDANGDWSASFDGTETGIHSLEKDTINGYLYAGASSGGTIYRCALVTSCDAQGDWSLAYDSSSAVIESLEFDSVNGVMYAGSSADGVIYRYNASGSAGSLVTFSQINAYATDTTNASEDGALGITTSVNGAAVQGFYLQGGALTLGTSSVAGSLNITDGAGGSLLTVSGTGTTLTVGGTVGLSLDAADTATNVCLNSSGNLATCTSSSRYKDNVENLGLGLDELRQLQPVSYTWNTTGQNDVGFIAEAVAQIIPQAVTYDAEGNVASFNYNTVTALLVSSVKQIDLNVQNLEDRVSALENNSISNLSVISGITVQNNLKVLGITDVQDIKVGGKIISYGNKPQVLADSTTQNNATITIVGTDTAGSVKVVTGTLTPADMNIKITFDSPYVSGTPIANLSAVGKTTADLGIYIVSISNNEMIIGFGSAPQNDQTYTFNYQIIQAVNSN